MTASRTDRCLDRRGFLRGLSAGLGLGCLGPGLARAHTAPGFGRGAVPRLILVMLEGGNDGLSTVVPFEDDDYHRVRPTTALQPAELLKIGDGRAFNKELTGLHELWNEGHVAIVEGCGYPNTNRSHFVSADIWHAGRLNARGADEGWVGRLSEQLDTPDGTANVLHLGARQPLLVRSRTREAIVVNGLERYRWGVQRDRVEALLEQGPAAGASSRQRALERSFEEARRSSHVMESFVASYETPVVYPATEFGDHLRTMAALIHGESSLRVFSTAHTGYDTHNAQLHRHSGLMQYLDLGLTALLRDLERSDAGRQTVVLVYSEFGRRVAENASGGTDHGAAGPVFALGAGVRGGLHGRAPSLQELNDGDLALTTDYRRVYSTLIERHFGASTAEVLDGDFEPLDFLESS